MLFSEPCLANPIVPNSLGQYYILALVIFAALGPVVETLLITHLFLKKRVTPGYKVNELFLPIIAINLITFIITHGLTADLSMLFSNKYLIFLAELFPLLSEFFFFYWYLNRKYKQELFAKPFSVKTILLITITANIVTFAIGIIAVFYFRYF